MRVRGVAFEQVLNALIRIYSVRRRESSINGEHKQNARTFLEATFAVHTHLYCSDIPWKSNRSTFDYIESTVIATVGHHTPVIKVSETYTQYAHHTDSGSCYAGRNCSHIHKRYDMIM